MSASAGPPTAPAPARPRLTRTDAGLIAAGATYLVVRRAALPFAAKDVALPLALWFAWLFVGLAWSPYKAGAFNYIAIVVTMIALVLATAAAGGSRRRLHWLGYTLILTYAFVVGFTLLEARLGIRLPTSRLEQGEPDHEGVGQDQRVAEPAEATAAASGGRRRQHQRHHGHDDGDVVE